MATPMRVAKTLAFVYLALAFNVAGFLNMRFLRPGCPDIESHLYVGRGIEYCTYVHVDRVTYSPTEFWFGSEIASIVIDCVPTFVCWAAAAACVSFATKMYL